MAESKFIKSAHFFEEDLVEDVAEVPVAPQKNWPANEKLRIIGKPVPRADAYDKVSGSARYMFDMTLPRMACCRILRCPHPHARIIKIDISAAEKMPGVLHILTHNNAPKIEWFNDSFLFDSHLRYAGDEVACVTAETFELAEQALRRIRVEYEQLPFVSSAEEALQRPEVSFHAEGHLLGGKPAVYSRGDFKAGLAAADVQHENTFSTPVVIQNPLEVHGSLVNWDGDRLTIWDSTQAVFGVRDTVAAKLKIPASKVRVIKKYMGGGFGSKLTAGKYTVMAALSARGIGRPVKVLLDRTEMHLAVGNRPGSVQTLKGGVKKDGTLTALAHYSFGPAGAFPSGAGCSWPLRTIYQCDNVTSEERSVYINAGPGRPFRAPGHVQGTFALESFIDELAEKIAMDPLQLRLKNMAGTDQVFNIPYTSKKLREAYLAGARAIGWEKRKPAGADKGPLKRGLGMATQIWWGGGGPPAYANLKLNSDGSVQVLSGTQDLGTGTYTILAQVAAEVLELPMEKIHVTLGDTQTTPYAPSSGGSTTAPSVTPAVRDAAEQMKTKLLQSGAVLMDLDESAVHYTNGKVVAKSDPAQKMSIQQIVRKSRERVLVTTGRREANPEGYMTNSFGAQFAEVEVDTQTGLVRVLKVVAAHDIGRPLNRRLLENQFHGGMMQGIGFALLEERVMDGNTGLVANANLHDYKMPVITDAPQFEVIIVSDLDPLNSNTGVKGIGEPAIIPTAAAIANAVYNAIGKRINHLPMTPDKILNALYA